MCDHMAVAWMRYDDYGGMKPENLRHLRECLEEVKEDMAKDARGEWVGQRPTSSEKKKNKKRLEKQEKAAEKELHKLHRQMNRTEPTLRQSLSFWKRWA